LSVKKKKCCDQQNELLKKRKCFLKETGLSFGSVAYLTRPSGEGSSFSLGG
jgi:hypothetical protein